MQYPWNMCPDILPPPVMCGTLEAYSEFSRSLPGFFKCSNGRGEGSHDGSERREEHATAWVRSDDA